MTEPAYAPPTGIYGPVTDWVTDLDHADPSYNPRAPEIWAELRERGCPVVHSDRYGGMWAPLTHELVSEVAYDTENFTSRAVVVSTAEPEDFAEAPIGGAPPITSDPPFHHLARRLLLPPFAPKKIEPWEPEVRKLCRQRLDDMGDIVAGETVVDAALQYAQHIPVNVIARMLGFPVEDDDLFREFVHDTLENVNQRARGAPGRLPAPRRLHRRADRGPPAPSRGTTSRRTCSTSSWRGRSCRSTTSGARSSCSCSPASTRRGARSGRACGTSPAIPDDRRRLVDEPELMPVAIEEFLRAYAPVTMARLVAKDHDFHGCPMKVDDWVLLPFPAANRDPAQFPDADEVVIDRLENRHAAFGLGIHRCLGSNLARLEVRVAVEEFLARFPDFELADPDAVVWSVGQIRGPAPAARCGCSPTA